MINVHESLFSFCVRKLNISAQDTNRVNRGIFNALLANHENCLEIGYTDSVYNMFTNPHGITSILNHKGIGIFTIRKIKKIILNELNKKGISSLQELQLHASLVSQ